MPSERRLATVLFLDIVSSTQRAAEVGDRRWRELLQRFQRGVRRRLVACGARDVRTTGDGFLATFADPEQALLCAWAIRDPLREMQLEVRTGLHLGEVEAVEGTVGGINVHIGSRISRRPARCSSRTRCATPSPGRASRSWMAGACPGSEPSC